jgi:hypothetical protein
MTWDNRDLLPTHGPEARARPGGTLFNRELSPSLDVERFPTPRPGRDVGPGTIAASWPRQQSKTLTLAASALFQEVVRFSGRPDRIDLHSSAIGVEFQYRNRGNEAVPGPVVRAIGLYETDASFDIVEARDPAGAGGQLVTVTGYWKAESTED